MSRFNNDKVMPRYFAIAVVLTIIGIAVIGKALYIMTAKKQYWTEVANRLKRDSVSVKPNRGNILSCDGQLMATSIPEYKIYMDFKASAFEEGDSLWLDKLDSICEGLHQIFPSRTAAEFKKHLEEGRHKEWTNKKTGKKEVGSRWWNIWPKRIDYGTYMEVRQLPFFNMSKNKSGFTEEVFNARRRPFGSLAMRTVGGIMLAKDSAYYGLELSCDSILRGTPGITGRRKILNKYMNIPVTLPVDGCDIVTTIDVNMQDLAERALLDMLKSPQVNGELGVVILMEVQTGDVKAIVNMMKNENGQYIEGVNSAISYRCEPGSVFKTASFLVALDDEVADTSYHINTGSGVREMHGRWMKDHNWRRGGYGTINMARTLEVSSNIGVSHVIDHFYGSNPERYVKGLYRVGIGEDLKIPLVGYQKPYIRMPERDKRGKFTGKWYMTTLPWMSIGYETQIAPINTVTFYNAIANNGKMVRPRFVKKVMKNGETVAEFPTEVIKERIAKPKAIKTMQTILEHVVSQGLGRKAGSPLFKVAGKTGTAQIADQYGGYHSGTTRYWLSFAGYFPADDPRYTCIVCIKKTGLPASGGGMSGVVFHHIAEGVMARHLKMSVDDAHDEHSVAIPDVKNGDADAANAILHNLGVSKRVTTPQPKYGRNITPDVTGMGAKDAVYQLESRGLKVKLQGRGMVKSQSYPAGKEIKQGSECVLVLQ